MVRAIGVDGFENAVPDRRRAVGVLDCRPGEYLRDAFHLIETRGGSYGLAVLDLDPGREGARDRECLIFRRDLAAHGLGRRLEYMIGLAKRRIDQFTLDTDGDDAMCVLQQIL